MHSWIRGNLPLAPWTNALSFALPRTAVFNLILPRVKSWSGFTIYGASGVATVIKLSERHLRQKWTQKRIAGAVQEGFDGPFLETTVPLPGVRICNSASLPSPQPRVMFVSPEFFIFSQSTVHVAPASSPYLPARLPLYPLDAVALSAGCVHGLYFATRYFNARDQLEASLSISMHCLIASLGA